MQHGMNHDPSPCCDHLPRRVCDKDARCITPNPRIRLFDPASISPNVIETVFLSRSKGWEKWWVKDISTKWWLVSTSYLSAAISATRLFGTPLPLFSGHSVMFGTAININKLKETFRTKCFPCLIWRCAHGQNMAERFPDDCEKLREVKRQCREQLSK